MRNKYNIIQYFVHESLTLSDMVTEPVVINVKPSAMYVYVFLLVPMFSDMGDKRINFYS